MGLLALSFDNLESLGIFGLQPLGLSPTSFGLCLDENLSGHQTIQD